MTNFTTVRTKARRYTLFLLLVFGATTFSYSQSAIVLDQGKTLRVSFAKTPPADAIVELTTPVNYSFYELYDPEGINISARPLPNMRVADTPSWESFGNRVHVPLTAQMTPGTVYLIKIDNVAIDGKPLAIVRFKASGEATVKTYNDPRNRMVLEANVELNPTDVVLEQSVLRISPDKQKLIVTPAPVAVTASKEIGSRMILTYGKKLTEARKYFFKATLKSDTGEKVIGKTKLIIPGLPEKQPDALIDATLSSEFGGNLRPQFNLVGVFRKPLGSWQNGAVVFEPTVSVDVGLGATKSKNAIILDLPTLKPSFTITRRKSGCEPNKPPVLAQKEFKEVIENDAFTEVKPETIDLDCYGEWANRGTFELSSIDLRIGPKFEMDRTFGRINALGAVRLDLNFDRWQHSISNRRSYLEIDLEKNAEYRGTQKDVYISWGYSITPRFGLEFGRKLTGEVLKTSSGNIRRVIEPFPIFRSYVGVTSIFEWTHLFRPMRLTISQDLFHLGYRETIGAVKGNELDLRTVRGFHPYGKVTLDIAFDPARHYNFTISYENGRAAPNFEYLNTVKPGIRILY
jgi:hypothetical protein